MPTSVNDMSEQAASDDAWLVHIGPLKSGSTSLQHTLAASTLELEAAGIVYPIIPGGREWNQTTAFLDLYREFPGDYCGMAWHDRIIRKEPWLYAGHWDKLIELSQCPDRRLIWSSEALSGATSSVVERIVSSMDRPLSKVLWLYRPLSAIIPSFYQEDTKSSPVPDFENYVRDVLGLLLRSNHPHAFSWMDASWVRAQWEPHCEDYMVVGDDNFSPESVDRCFQVLVGGGHPEQQVRKRSNQGLSAAANEALRQALIHVRPKYVGASFATVQNMATYDSPLGGKYRLKPDVAKAVDDAWGRPSAGEAKERAVDRARSLLHSSNALTYVDLPQGANFDDEVASLRSRVQRELTRRDVRTRIGMLRRRVRRQQPRYIGIWH